VIHLTDLTADEARALRAEDYHRRLPVHNANWPAMYAPPGIRYMPPTAYTPKRAALRRHEARMRRTQRLRRALWATIAVLAVVAGWLGLLLSQAHPSTG